MRPEIAIVSTSKSFTTVRNFVEFLIRAVTDWCGAAPLLFDYNTSEMQLPLNRAIVICFGQDLPPLRTEGPCYAVLLNFSVVFNIRPWPWQSLRAWRLIARKRRKFFQRLPSIDAIMDYFPLHYEKMKRLLPQKTFGCFPLGLYSSPRPFISPERAIYDVCTVGSLSPRRERVWMELTRRGFRCSPHVGDLEQLIESSRCTLNIHLERYPNFEGHRILSSLACGRPVVSENMTGPDKRALCPSVLESRYCDLIQTIIELCSDKASLAELAEQGYEYFWRVYWPRTHAEWQQILNEVREAALQKLAL